MLVLILNWLKAICSVQLLVCVILTFQDADIATRQTGEYEESLFSTTVLSGT
jgi:hypothetical protein